MSKLQKRKGTWLAAWKILGSGGKNIPYSSRDMAISAEVGGFVPLKTKISDPALTHATFSVRQTWLSYICPTDTPQSGRGIRWWRRGATRGTISSGLLR